MSATRVFIIDDHPVVRAGLRELLKRPGEIIVVGDAEDAGSLTMRAIGESGTNVAVVDIKLKRGSGLEACAEIKRTLPGVRVILLSAFWNDTMVRQALDAGADGYLLKDAEHFDLTKAIHSVAYGSGYFDTAIAAAIVRQSRRVQNETTRPITEDDARILRLVANGLTNKAVAQALSLSHYTVRDRLSAIMQSLDARNRTEAVQVAVQRGII